MPDSDDLIAKALAEAGLSAELPGGTADDPLARAFAAAGLAAPTTASTSEPEPDTQDQVEEALADLATRRPAVLTERVDSGDGVVPVPRWPAGTATGVGSMP